MRILILKTTSMGDVVHALPVATDLARFFRKDPGSLELDWVVEEQFEQLPRLHPAIDRTLAVAVRRWRQAPLAPSTWAEWQRWRDAVRQRRYGLVLDLQGLIKSALLATQTIGPRAGFGRATVREPMAAMAYQKRYDIDVNLHPVERMRRLAGAALGYKPEGMPVFGLRLPADPVDEVAQFVARLDGVAFALLLHATARAEKHWPTAHWRLLLEVFEEARRFTVLPWGNAEERARAMRLSEGLRFALVAPALSLGDAIWLATKARVVAGVDTGLLHVAAASGAPLVGIFTATDPQRYFPYWLPRAEAVGRVGEVPTVDAVRSAIGRIGSWH